MKSSSTTRKLGLEQLLDALRKEGLISLPPQPAATAVDGEIERFEEYLLNVSGLSANTVLHRIRYVRQFSLSSYGARTDKIRQTHRFPDYRVRLRAGATLLPQIDEADLTAFPSLRFSTIWRYW